MGGMGGMGMGGMGMGGMGMGGAGGMGDAYEQCIMEAGNDACGMCICGNCLMQASACQADVGCSEITKCALEKMCTGADCLDPAVCGMVIDMYGGAFGPSGMKAIALGQCIQTNCQMDCTM
jgi:hypothetical protein